MFDDFLIDNNEDLERNFDKRDDFDFLIAYYPFMCSNIPVAPCSIFIPQLILSPAAFASLSEFCWKRFAADKKATKSKISLDSLKS